MGDAVVKRADALVSATALKEVSNRLRLRGEDRAADSLQAVAEALMSATTVHIHDGGRAC